MELALFVFLLFLVFASWRPGGRVHVLDCFDVPPPVPAKSMDGLPWDFKD